MDREKVIDGLMRHYLNEIKDPCDKCQYFTYKDCEKKLANDAISLLKAQEPVKPILARGWYWCGGVVCRNSLTSALDDDSPARKPNYCEECGRAVKWE